MKEMGAIEQSSSECSSPIILVPKIDGTLRFCLDFRKVNGVGKIDLYPMPRVDDLMENSVGPVSLVLWTYAKCTGRFRLLRTVSS